MSRLLELYKCPSTGDVVKVSHSGNSPEDTICTGETTCEWQHLPEKMREEGLTEKHVPVIEKADQGIRVKIGSTPHPMIPEHHIEWVEVRKGPYLFIQKLDPTGPPEATFPWIDDTNVKARIYCNIHQLWTNKQ